MVAIENVATENEENETCQIEIGKSYMFFFNKKHFLGKVTQLGSKAACKKTLDTLEHELKSEDNIPELNQVNFYNVKHFAIKMKYG